MPLSSCETVKIQDDQNLHQLIKEGVEVAPEVGSGSGEGELVAEAQVSWVSNRMPG
jgi:hypothetical protein